MIAERLSGVLALRQSESQLHPSDAVPSISRTNRVISKGEAYLEHDAAVGLVQAMCLGPRTSSNYHTCETPAIDEEKVI